MGQTINTSERNLHVWMMLVGTAFEMDLHYQYAFTQRWIHGMERDVDVRHPEVDKWLRIVH